MTINPTEITNADLLEAFTGFRAEILGRLDRLESEMRTGFQNAAAERQALRNVLDHDMADLKSMVNVERRLSKLEAAIEKPARIKR